VPEIASEKELHDEVDLIGLRAHATAVGLVQLCNELCHAGILDKDAIGRIKTAIAKEISLTRPRSAARGEYEKALRKRLDALFAGKMHFTEGDPRTVN